MHWHGIQRFSLQFSTEPRRLWACLLHSTAISLVSTCHQHPSVRHLMIGQYVWFGQKIVHGHHSEKHLMGQVEVVYTFWDKKRTPFVLLQLKVILCSASTRKVTTNIQKTMESTNTRSKHTYVISKHHTDDSQPYFSQYTQLLLSSAALRGHQGKQRIDTDSELSLALNRWFQ